MEEPLPIVEYRQAIISAVGRSSVVIIKAETGAGKSTQVPQFLLECAPKIVVTQPRRPAAIGLAERVAEEMKCELGGIVGYRTSLDRKDTTDTRILYCTDGLELVRETLGNEQVDGVLVIDEVHEWNLNIETLVAWTRYQLVRGMPYKVVIMSATIKPAFLVEYFGGGVIVEVPGRTFPITERRPKQNLEESVAALLRERHNVLVFQPGKADIARTVFALQEMRVNAEIFTLHAEMSYADQATCFRPQSRPKCIVSTNIAQTSITIPDIDAVVDSGLERCVEYIDGVEGLYIRPISLADRDQRKGRAGRTKPGIYVDTCPHKLQDRKPFSEPDILRLPIDKTVLQLARVGVDIEELTFFHQPTDTQIQSARDTLYALGCIDRWGALTHIGKRVATLPISPRWGRMLVEAEDRHVLPDVITLVAIMEQGRITNGKSEKWREAASYISSWSDAFIQLAAYEAALKIPPDKLEEYGIDQQAFLWAWNERHRLHALSLNSLEHQHSTGRPRDIVRSIYAGLPDRLYKKSVVLGYKDKAGNTRDLPRGSIVADADWIVGLPWNLQVRGDFGPKTMRFITMATRVNPALLAEVVPHLATTKEKESTEKAGQRLRVVQTYFNGILLAEEQKRTS